MLGCRRDPETSMRNFSFFPLTLIGLALSLSLTGCPAGDSSAETMAEETTGDGDGDSGDGDGDTGDGDGDGNTGDGDCYMQPAECAQFVRCIGVLAPGQLETVDMQYGETGSCWCGTEQEAQGCYNTCLEQIATALQGNPTVPECQEEYCTIDELDPDQPYGPIVNGSCTDYISAQGDPIPQMPIMSPLGVAGGYCAPKCSGLANYCPEHTQTSAQGTCYLSLGMDSYCITRCYVDSTILGGHQCQCGATCQPQGAPDGDNNMRG